LVNLAKSEENSHLFIESDTKILMDMVTSSCKLSGTIILDAIFNPFSKNIFEKVGDKRNAKFWLEECAVCEKSNKLFSFVRDK
jgi:hypothetical protein